jgi:hypothetical protein
VRRSILVAALCVIVAGCAGTPSPASPSTAAALPSSTPRSSVSGAPPTQTPTPTQVQAARCAKRDLPFDPAAIDLTGAWSADDDGLYYLRQIGKNVWWNGMSGRTGTPDGLGRDWNNVAAGEIQSDLMIELDWADVPRGEILGSGTLTWIIEEVDGNTRLRKVAETGDGFGGGLFTPCAPG